MESDIGMIHRIRSVLRRRKMARDVSALPAAALIVALLLATLAACSDATPTPAPTTIAPPPSATPAATAPPLVPTPTMAPTDLPASTPPSPAVVPTDLPASTPPSPTVVPTESPDQAIDAAKLDAISGASDEVHALIEDLIAELGPRVSGSEAELRAAELLKQRYDSFGYEAEIQPFTASRFDFAKWSQTGGANAEVAVESPEKVRFYGLPLTSSPSGTRASGPLMSLDLGESDDLPEDEIDGKVIHLLFGNLNLGDVQVVLRLQDQVNRLAESGAVAVVLSRKLGERTPYRPLFGVDSKIPALIISGDQGRQIEQLATGQGELIASMKIDIEALDSRNVIAELRGTGDDLVVVGAHYDTVPQAGVGANDNASGTAVLLSLAKVLAGQSLPFTVRFVSFGAEEVGLYGSSHYAASLSEEEIGRLKAMLNLDVVGSGDYTAVSGHQELSDLALTLAAELNLQAQHSALPPGATSDHEPFELAGAPVLLFWAPDISRIHSPEDRLEFVDPRRLGETFLLAEALLTSPEFPPK